MAEQVIEGDDGFRAVSQARTKIGQVARHGRIQRQRAEFDQPRRRDRDDRFGNRRQPEDQFFPMALPPSRSAQSAARR